MRLPLEDGVESTNNERSKDDVIKEDRQQQIDMLGQLSEEMEMFQHECEMKEQRINDT